MSTAPISIPDRGNASPYPSVIQVAGTMGPIEDVTVELRSFTHTFLSDLNITVQSPQGTVVRLWGSSGGLKDAQGGTYTFSTTGASLLPEGSVLPPGSYQPQGQLVDGEASSLTALNGEDANGAWKLYVRDRVSGDSGGIGNWAVNVTTGAPDEIPPAISIDSPADGSRHLLGSTVVADYACTDEALVSCEGPVADGAALDTSSVGSRPFAVTATDASGNDNVRKHTWSVVWNFSGFFSPVDAGPDGSVYNVVKGGSVVPVKFSLDGYRGLDVLAGGAATSKRTGCDGTATQDPLEETATPGASQLTYDAATDRYSYNWKTDKAWASTCRELVVELADGTRHTALFSFRK